MADSEDYCDNWVDAAICDPSLEESLGTLATTCSDTIESFRYGFCRCYTPNGGNFQMWSACNHKPFTCSDICYQATRGCKDTSQQLAKVFVAGTIVSCNGQWLSPGLNHAESQLCDTENGYEICNDLDRVKSLGLGAHNCAYLSNANTFYATKISTTQGILGCGNVQNYDDLPVVREYDEAPFSLSMERNSFHGPMTWKMEDITGNIVDNVYKTSVSGGGVLCCKKTEAEELASFGTVFLQLIIFILLFSTITICLIKIIGFIMDRWIIPSEQNNTCCCGWCRTDRIITVFGLRIPLSITAWKKLKKMKDVEKIKCKPYSEFKLDQERNRNDDDDVITETSGQCIICLEEYCMDSQVIYLNCAHHFHYDCGARWLMEHEECPVCRQYFKTAKNRHSINNKISQIEMRQLCLQSDSNRASDDLNPN